MTAALNDRALQKLAWLLQQPSMAVAPEHVSRSEDHAVYRHLHASGALAQSSHSQAAVLCPSCEDQWLEPRRISAVDSASGSTYRVLCLDCGWVDLQATDLRNWQPRPAELARWLGSALRLTPRYEVEELLPNRLWRLGESEVHRRRRVWFYGCRLASNFDDVLQSLKRRAPKEAAVVLTFDAKADWAPLAAQAIGVIELQAVARLRKSGFVLDGLEHLLLEQSEHDPSHGRAVRQDLTKETSLRLIRSTHVALIDGQRIPVQPDARTFLLLLLEADSQEIHKSQLAERMGKPHNFKVSAVFRHCKSVFDRFVVIDERGRYRIDTAYCWEQTLVDQKGGRP